MIQGLKYHILIKKIKIKIKIKINQVIYESSQENLKLEYTVGC